MCGSGYGRGVAVDSKWADLRRFKVMYRAIACGADCAIDCNIMEVLPDL